MDDFIIINGYKAPPPRTYQVQAADLDSDETNRSESGYLHRDRLRQGVYKIIATWRVDVTTLKALTESVEPTFFTVEFIDLTRCRRVTATMYAGDRSATVVKTADNIGEVLVDFSVNLIEM